MYSGYVTRRVTIRTPEISQKHDDEINIWRNEQKAPNWRTGSAWKPQHARQTPGSRPADTHTVEDQHPLRPSQLKSQQSNKIQHITPRSTEQRLAGFRLSSTFAFSCSFCRVTGYLGSGVKGKWVPTIHDHSNLGIARRLH